MEIKRDFQAEYDLLIAIEDAIQPLLREHGYPRSEVERLRPAHSGGKTTDIGFLQFLTRRKMKQVSRRA